jgi:hypothetical protein
MNKTHEGFFSFIIMVFIACGVAWWYGWDKMALSYINTAITTGTDAKQNVMNQVDGVKKIMKDRDAQYFKEMGEEPVE